LRTHAFGRTQGWLLLGEALTLHAAVIDHLDATRPISVVEIGSWKGRSTVVLALAVGTASAGTVIAIDPHDNSVEAEVRGLQDSTLPEMVQNLDRAGVSDLVRIHRCRSADVLPAIPDNSVDVLFVDGSHRYEDVLADIAGWRPKLRDGATVAFNDWSMPEVWRALRRSVLPFASRYVDSLIVDNTLFVRYSKRLRALPKGRAKKLALRREIKRQGLPATWSRPARDWS
jgi:precorrin-6B methylase 2